MSPPLGTRPNVRRRTPGPALTKGRAAAALSRACPLKSEVVLVTHNSEADLARSLTAIREAARAARAELLFVDLGSSDGTRAFAARHAPGARGIWLRDDDGLAEALAAAAAASDADVLVVLRPTVKPSSAAAIAQLVAHLAEHPYAAVAAPALRDHAGTELRTTRQGPSRGGFSRVEWVPGEAIAVRRADVGGLVGAGVLDHALAELELCVKLRCRGREIHYLHEVGWLVASGRAAGRLRVGRRALPLRAWRLLLAHPAYALRLIESHPTLALAADRVRRGFDIAVSMLALVVLAPIWLAIVLAIRIDSPGPAIFRQRRLGHQARPFQMYKFRTMRCDSDPSLHEQFVRDMIVNRLQTAEGATPKIFKVHPDPRVTRMGRLLRRTSLDELPQLLNVLRGEMTLVGFRPPIPYEVDEYPPWYYRRFDGKPGITGLWQVSGRNQRSYEEMVTLDIEYHNRRTWLLDLVLLARTVGAVISGRGAY
jgi:lipopolysaccharide/colanic/teichoic acid biosynthesis glycosyltransferase